MNAEVLAVFEDLAYAGVTYAIFSIISKDRVNQRLQRSRIANLCCGGAEGLSKALGEVGFDRREHGI